MKLVPLTGKRGVNKFVLVDDEDYDLVMQYKWYVTTGGYPYHDIWNDGNGRRIKIPMHRLIINPPKNMVVDHIDGNPLNNQKYNLRICTQSQNLLNGKKRMKGTSAYKGASLKKRGGLWEAQIRKDGKKYLIGYFRNERYAAMAYDLWARDLHGEFAGLNFPEAIGTV